MTPDFRIVANGEDVTAVLADRLLSLTVTDEDGEKSDRVEIELDDRDGRISAPDMDTILEVSLGFKGGALSLIGRYAVDGVAGSGVPQTLSITATAADLKSGIRAPKTRGWEDKTLSDIVGTIAGEAGLRAITGASVSGTRWPFLAQTAESDLHFLTRIAATLDATAKPAGGALIVQRRGEGKTAAGDALTPPKVTRANLIDWTWNLEGRAVYKSVEAEWTETQAGALRKVKRGEGQPLKKLRHVLSSEAEAIRACEAALSGAGRAAMTLSATLSGFWPGLLAGATVTVEGLRPELNGEWQLKTVTHALGNGLITSFEAKKGEPE